MTRTSKIVMGVLIVAVILTGIGYAALTGTTLNVSGTLSGQAMQTDFLVRFTNAITVDANSKGRVIARKTDDTNAVFSVDGLEVKGDTASATYTIQNTSKGIAAEDIEIAVEEGTNAYFETTVSSPSKSILQPGETATITVTTKLKKTPLTAQSLNVGVTITASPVETSVSLITPEECETCDGTGTIWEECDGIVNVLNLGPDAYEDKDGTIYYEGELECGKCGAWNGMGSVRVKEDEIEDYREQLALSTEECNDSREVDCPDCLGGDLE